MMIRPIIMPGQENGFTLVELLVALFVFGLISLAGVGMLRSSADAQVIIKERLADQAAISRTANLLEADLAQAIRRGVRDPRGNSRPAFAQGSAADGDLFAFTRSGLDRDGEGTQSATGRVAYGFSNGALTRKSWTHTDGGEEMPAAPLVDDLQDVAVRFRDERGVWRDDWSAIDAAAMPRAVELNLTPKQGAPLRLVFLVSSQLRQAAPLDTEGGDVESGQSGNNDAI